VTITNRQEHDGTIFIIISEPSQPENLVLNYLPYEVEFFQCSNKEDTSKYNCYKAGTCTELDSPKACAFTFNPLVDKDKCDIEFRIWFKEADKPLEIEKITFEGKNWNKEDGELKHEVGNTFI
jgi:hypothetical protein